MTRYLIATHGNLAEGYKNSLGILLGMEIAGKITTINAFSQVEDPKKAIDEYILSLDNKDQAVLFTDWLNGSVNQACIPYAARKNVFILTGINLPLLCEVLTGLEAMEGAVGEDFLRASVMNAGNEILYVNDAFKAAADSSLTEEEFF